MVYIGGVIPRHGALEQLLHQGVDIFPDGALQGVIDDPSCQWARQRPNLGAGGGGHAGVKAILLRVPFRGDADEVEAFQPCLAGEIVPSAGEFRRVGDLGGFVDREKPFPVNGDVALVLEGGQESLKVPLAIVLSGVALLHERLVAAAVPYPGPGFVGPRETKREIRAAAVQHLLEGSLQKPFSFSKPVVPVAESLNAV